MEGFLGWLGRVGRGGGIVAIVLGVGLLVFTAFQIIDTRTYLPAVVGAALFLIVIGAVILIFGNPAARGKYEVREVKPRGQLLHDITKHGYPVTICTKYHRVVKRAVLNDEGIYVTDGTCRDCNPVLDHVDVDNEEDLQLALASLQ